MPNCCANNFEISQKHTDSLFPIGSGNERCLPGHTWGAGVRNHYVIHYVVSGKGVFYCGPKKYNLSQGDIFVIYPGTIVKYQADEKDPWHYMWVNFYGGEAKEIFADTGISVLNPIMKIKNAEETISIIEKMPTERSADTAVNLNFTANLYTFMSLIVSNGLKKEGTENTYLESAVKYIKAHYYDDISVEQIASHIGISRKYLFALFKKSLGISPKDYIIDYRIKRAKEFLKDKNLPIGNIAYSVGYSDPLTFSKMFKLKVGISPTEYRER